MAAEEKNEQADAEQPKKKKGLPKTAIMIAAIMLVEAGGFMAAMKFMGAGPARSEAAEKTAEEGGEAKGESAEGGHGEAAKSEGGHGEAKAESGHGETKAEGGPGEQKSGEGHGGATYVKPASPNATAEVKLLSKFRVPNSKNGKNFIYDFDIAAVVPEARKAEAERLIADRAGEIADRAAQIIRAADTRVLNEDDFETLRLQLRQAFVRVCGDEKLIQRVLIPRCVPMRTD